MYGIPEFRLPKEIVEREVDDLVRLGVELRLNCIVGETVTLDNFLQEQNFDAVFVGVGAGQPMRLGVPGEDLGGIYTAAEYLARVNSMQVHLFRNAKRPPLAVRASAFSAAGTWRWTPQEPQFGSVPPK